MAKVRMTRKEKAQRFNEELGLEQWPGDKGPPLTLDEYFDMIEARDQSLETMPMISAAIH